MKRPSRPFHRALPRATAILAALALLVTACGGSGTVEPDPDLAPLVGDWEATELTLTNVAAPGQSVDLIQQGAGFSLNVQPSGQYTAILVFGGQDQTEIGQAEVSGNRLTLIPNVPAGQPTTTGTYTLQGDVLTLDGSTEFDFNLDGTPEPATVHLVLARE